MYTVVNVVRWVDSPQSNFQNVFWRTHPVRTLRFVHVYDWHYKVILVFKFTAQIVTRTCCRCIFSIRVETVLTLFKSNFKGWVLIGWVLTGWVLQKLFGSYFVENTFIVPHWPPYTCTILNFTHSSVGIPYQNCVGKKCQILGVDIVKKLNNKKSWLPKIVRSRDIVMKMLGKWSHGSNWLTDTISSWKNKIKFSFSKKVWRWIL